LIQSLTTYYWLIRMRLKIITKAICKAYKDGLINDVLFEKLIEFLLGFFLETTFQEKISKKTFNMNHKLMKLFGFSHLLF